MSARLFSVIYADPPWSYKDGLPGPGRGAASHYPVLTDAEIVGLPVWKLGARDCVLFLWATGAKLDVGIDTVKGWGFQFVTVAFDWCKTTKYGAPAMGMGRWTRSAHEFVLMGRRGKPVRQSARVHQTVARPRLKHSAKPQRVAELIVELMGDVPRIELFSRKRLPGWAATGLELDGKDIREILK